MYSSNMNDDKDNMITVLLIGSTGSGKSTLANVISGSDDYDESHCSACLTKDINVHNYLIDGNVYRIIDTIRIGHTRIPSKEVVSKMVMAAEAINQVFFVVGGRFTDLEIECFEILQSTAFDKNIFEYTTIVRTNFSDFEDDTKCEKDYQDMTSGNNDISEFVKSCKKVIHVDNPPISRRIRQGAEETRRIKKKKY
nr:9575_t:CDS:1 [Entrophospora candida]